jgi:hypothetical protein
MNDDLSVLVVGAEVRAIRNTGEHMLALVVEDRSGKLHTCIHSTGELGALQGALTEKAQDPTKFGSCMVAEYYRRKALHRHHRQTAGDETTGICRGWRVTYHKKHGIQLWAAAEITDKFGSSVVPALVQEIREENIEGVLQDLIGEEIPEDGRWGILVRELIGNLSEVLPLGSVWPLKVGYHGKYVVNDQSPSESPDEPTLVGAGGSQLPEISTW